MNDEKAKVTVIHADYVFSLTDEDLSDILITALNGGIGYWACLDNTTEEWDSIPDDAYTDEYAAQIILNGGKLEFDIAEYGTLYFDKDALVSGIRKFVERGYDTYHAFYGSTVDLMRFDAQCGDCVMQLGFFDDIVFG